MSSGSVNYVTAHYVFMIVSPEAKVCNKYFTTSLYVVRIPSSCTHGTIFPGTSSVILKFNVEGACFCMKKRKGPIAANFSVSFVLHNNFNEERKWIIEIESKGRWGWYLFWLGGALPTSWHYGHSFASSHRDIRQTVFIECVKAQSFSLTIRHILINPNCWVFFATFLTISSGQLIEFQFILT